MLILIYNAINKWRGKLFLIRKPYKTNKNISRLFYILMMIIFVWFIGIQILGPDEQFFDQSGHSIIYNGTFTWKKSDGTKQNYSAILRLQMPERNFVWNLQHIRVTTLVLSIRFTVEIKCRSGVIFLIITSL